MPGIQQPELKGKNAKAALPTRPAEPAPVSKHSGSVQANLWTPLLQIFTGAVDQNTGLRNEESINKKLSELKAAN